MNTKKSSGGRGKKRKVTGRKEGRRSQEIEERYGGEE